MSIRPQNVLKTGKNLRLSQTIFSQYIHPKLIEACFKPISCVTNPLTIPSYMPSSFLFHFLHTLIYKDEIGIQFPVQRLTKIMNIIKLLCKHFNISCVVSFSRLSLGFACIIMFAWCKGKYAWREDFDATEQERNRVSRREIIWLLQNPWGVTNLQIDRQAQQSKAKRVTVNGENLFRSLKLLCICVLG